MSSSHPVPLGTSRTIRNSIAAFLLIAAFILCVSRVAVAATYTYTPTESSAADHWSAGTNWSGIPVSHPSTELTFVGDNTTILPNGLTNTSINDIAGPFSLNILNLQGTGPASGAATININSVFPSSYLTFFTSGPTYSSINLNALAGDSGLTYNIGSTVVLSNSTAFFQGNEQQRSISMAPSPEIMA